MKKHLHTLFAASILALSMVGSAHSNVVTVGSQASFSALGTVVQNTNWDSYGTGWTYPGNSFVVGDLTFVQGGTNLIGGSAYGMVRNLLTDDNVRGTTALVANTYDLFAFSAGNFLDAAASNFFVTTNLGSYSFSEVVPIYANGGSLSFIGFAADPGEYFTSVAWYGNGATGVTDIQLGSANVPEPGSLALLGLGLAGLAYSRKRKAQPTAA